MAATQVHPRDRETGREREAGFSLIEVLVVTAVIAILMSVCITSLQNAFDRARQRATMSDMRTISKALEIYRADTGHYPTSGQTMTQLVAILIPYQTSVLPSSDAWKHPYTYDYDNVDNYTIASYGKDGVDGPDVNYST